MAVDQIDRLIIGTLVDEGRLSWRDLGERVGLGASATAERVRRLQSIGVIEGYTVRLNHELLGRVLRAVIDVRLGPGADIDRFERVLAASETVESAVHVTGPFDYLVHVACTGVGELDRTVRSWKEAFGGETNTRILLHEVDLGARRSDND